jgi:predicted DNA-binding transcriptional regulator AlpA
MDDKRINIRMAAEKSGLDRTTILRAIQRREFLADLVKPLVNREYYEFNESDFDKWLEQRKAEQQSDNN